MNVSAYATRLAALVGMAFFLAGPAPAAIHTVTVGPGLTFSPASITITEGDTIEWSFAGGFHSVRSGSGCISDGTFDSGAVSVAGTTYSFTYNTAGTYDYHCGVGTHCAFGMEGSVTVEAAPPRGHRTHGHRRAGTHLLARQHHDHRRRHRRMELCRRFPQCPERVQLHQ